MGTAASQSYDRKLAAILSQSRAETIILPIGTKLYTGESSALQNELVDPFNIKGQRKRPKEAALFGNKYVQFFALDKSIAQGYALCSNTHGWVHSFRVARPLELINIDDSLYDLYDTEDLAERCSSSNGVYLNRHNNDPQKQNEIALCDPKSKLTYIGSQPCAGRERLGPQQNLLRK